MLTIGVQQNVGNNRGILPENTPGVLSRFSCLPFAGPTLFSFCRQPA